MQLQLRVLVFLLALIHTTAWASPAEAERVKQLLKTDMEKWGRDYAAATTDEARTALAEKRPDPAVYARRMWQFIGASLDQEWALDPMAWFVSVTMNLHTEAKTTPGTETLSSVPVFAKELQAVAEAVPAYHMKSEKLAALCLSYASAADPSSMKLLEKIESAHARKTVQGVAALAIAIRLRALGDAPELMSRRMAMLQKAIIESADMEIQGAAVAKIIQEELYVLTNLTKGRPAPACAGVDSSGRPMDLSSHRGKIVVLLFWNGSVPGVVPLLETLGKLGRTGDGKVVVVGVNNDTVENLRVFQRKDADLLDFPNFSDPKGDLAKVFRVGAWPMAFVIDGRGVIAYSGTPGTFMRASVQGLLEQKPAAPVRPPSGTTPR